MAAEWTLRLWNWQAAHAVLSDWLWLVVFLCGLVLYVALRATRDIYKALNRKPW